MKLNQGFLENILSVDVILTIVFCCVIDGKLVFFTDCKPKTVLLNPLKYISNVLFYFSLGLAFFIAY